MTHSRNPRCSPLGSGRALLASIAVAVTALLFAAPAQAEFGIASFDGAVNADAAGEPFTQAGGHPYDASASISFNICSETYFGFLQIPCEDARDVYVDLPPGFLGNPNAMPTCTEEEIVMTFTCPVSTQVGFSEVFTSGFFPELKAPVFNMEAPPGVPAMFAFSFAGVIVHLEAELRPDYSVRIKSEEINQAEPIKAVITTLWGVPADPAHDAKRGKGVNGFNCVEEPVGTCSNPAGVPRIAFLSNPTRCTAPGVGLETKLTTDSWVHPGDFEHASFFSHLAPPNEATQQGPDGCENVPFEPRMRVEPTSSEADSPTGLGVEVTVPQDGLTNSDGIAPAHLKRAVVELPDGMSLNPSAADGLVACSPSEIGLGSNEPQRCPTASKIGSLAIETPILDETIEGGVYLAQQGSNPFNSLLALYLVAENPERGITVKLPGKVSPDPETGRLVAEFDDNPQLPFSSLRLKFSSGDRAPLVTPSACGTYTTTTKMSPWSAADPDNPTAEEIVTSTSSFTIDSGPGGSPCPAPDRFDPSFEAGTVTPIAGSYSPLVVNGTRPDGSQILKGVSLDLPKGLTGKLAGIPYCSDAALAAATGKTGRTELASSSCPAQSQIGTVDVAAGAGKLPFYVGGRAYLAGPYKGAPLSVAVVTPAVAGPFDLGTVVVRAKADVDPSTAQIHVVSDAIPSILQGIPLKVRSVGIAVDRPDFTLNPTSCEPTSFDGILFGASVSQLVSSRFQVGACDALAFEPKLSLRFSGATHRSAHPALKATLTMPKGGANVGKAVVTLPKTEFLENAHIRTICTRVQYAADNCPKGSVYGYAKAWTPLLDKPLQGPVYLRSSNHTLPDLVASLDGQIHIDLAGRIDSPGGRIRNTFWAVPDAPVSKFVLTMQGGSKGLLVNNTELCLAKPRAKAEFTGQNGKVSVSKPLVRIGCGKKGK